MRLACRSPFCFFFVGFVALLTALMACGGSGSSSAPTLPSSGAPPADEISYELFPSTVQLDAATTGTLRAADADGTLHFPSVEGDIAKISANSVILAPMSPTTPHGLLRFVLSVAPEGNGVAVKTMPAPLQLAFRRLHIKAATRNIPSFTPATAPGHVGPLGLMAGGMIPVDFLAFDGDGDESTTNDQLRVQGELGGSVDYFFGLDIDWVEVAEIPLKVITCLPRLLFDSSACSLKEILPEAKVGFTAEAKAEASLAVDGVAYKGYSRTFPIADIDLAVFAIGPVVIFPSIQINGTIEGGASSRFSIATGITADMGASATLSTKTKGTFDPPHAHVSAMSPKTEVVLGAKAKASIGPSLSLKIFDLIGPHVGFSVYAELDADSSMNPCFSTHYGATADVGVAAGLDIPVFGNVVLFDVDKQTTIVDEVADTGSCTLPPGGVSMNPPGQGPDDQTFSHPAFAPFVNSYSGAFGEFPYSNYTGLGFGSSLLSIDGDTVFSGSDMTSLTKFDNAGNLVWSEKLIANANLDTISNRNSTELRPNRTAVGADGTLMVVADPFVLVSLEQNGDFRWAKHITGVDGDDYRRFTQLVADGTGGFWVTGSRGPSNDQTRAWLLHVAGDGTVLSSQLWGPTSGETYATSLVVVPKGLRVGSYTRGAHEGYLTDFDASGAYQKATLITPSCDEDIAPVSAFLRTDGGMTIAGIANTLPTEDFLLTLHEDGSLGSQGSFSANNDLSDCSPSIDSIVPLSSTGFIVGGSCSGDSTVGTQIFLASLDAKGLPLWSYSYGGTMTEAGSGEEGYASVLVTDDGGAMFIGYADEGDGTGNTRLLVGKPFAKDGVLMPKAGAPFTAAPVQLVSGACTMALSPLTTLVPAHDMVTTEPFAMKVSKITTKKTAYLP